MTISRRDFSLGFLSTATALSLGVQSAFAGPEHIIKRPIPSSGEMIPIIGIGTNRYGVGESAKERAPLRAALQRFHEWGGTLIDTAPAYRTSESVLGDLIADLGVRDDFFVAHNFLHETVLPCARRCNADISNPAFLFPVT